MLLIIILALLAPAWVATEAILLGQRRTRAAIIEAALVLACFVVVPGLMYVLYQPPANPDPEQIATRGEAAAFVTVMVSPWLAGAVVVGAALVCLRRAGPK